MVTVAKSKEQTEWINFCARPVLDEQIKVGSVFRPYPLIGGINERLKSFFSQWIPIWPFTLTRRVLVDAGPRTGHEH